MTGPKRGRVTTSLSLASPARLSAIFPNVVSASAVDDQKELWTTILNNPFCTRDCGSNYGNQITVAAPGDRIHSDLFQGGCDNAESGTSLAAPYVTGVAGLILAAANNANRSLNAADMKTIIHDTAEHSGNFDPENNEILLLNAAAAVQRAMTSMISSIWPMSGHDPQRTGLSPFTGRVAAPSNPLWTFSTSAPIVGDIAVSSEGNIYFASDKLYALKPDGTAFVPPVSMSAVTSPAIDDRNGFVYIGVINANGGRDVLRYTKQLQSPTVVFSGATGSTLILGDNGAVYLVYGRFPGSVTAAGPVNWTIALCPGETGINPGSPTPGAPAIGRDGSVYVTCPEASIFKLDGQTGQILANAGVGSNETEPMMDAQNHIWLGNMTFGGIIFFGSYGSLDSNLNPLTGSAGPSIFTTSRATLLPDGSTVRRGYTFFPDSILSCQGVHNWNIELPNPYAEQFASLPTADAAGKIFIGSTSALYCLTPIDGSVIWRFQLNAGINTQPVVSNNGNVYIGANDGKVYAF